MYNKYLSLALATLLFTACGGNSSSNKVEGEGAIDLSLYFPSTSMNKQFITTQRDGDNINKSSYDEIITVTGNTITTKTGTETTEKVVISDKNITTTEDNETKSTYRHVDIGDTIFTDTFESNETNDLGQISTKFNASCKIESKENKFEKNDNLYSGDLLKIKCIVEGNIIYDIKQTILDAGAATDLNGTHAYYDTSYIYLKAGIGEVATIDDNCVFNEKLTMVVDDRKASTECIKQQYNYDFYLP